MDNSSLYEKNMQMLSLAVEYCEDNFEHDALIKELYRDDDLKKQLCLIEIKKILTQNEADILVENLTGKSGPIRETASFKILELIKNDNFNKFFQTHKIIDTFVKAIIDINPSVSRNIVQVITFVEDVEYLYKKIIEQTKKTLSSMENIKQNRSYTTNKQKFSLYWNLEAIINIADKIKINEELVQILKTTALSNDYTIREKTANASKILNCPEILLLFKEDENIYVKRYL